MIFKNFIFDLLIAVSLFGTEFPVIAQDLYEGFACQTRDNKPGTCVSLGECKSIVQGLRSRRLDFSKDVKVCSYDRNIAIICCSDIPPTPESTRTPISISKEDASNRIFFGEISPDPTANYSETTTTKKPNTTGKNVLIINNNEINEDTEYIDLTKLLKPNQTTVAPLSRERSGRVSGGGGNFIFPTEPTHVSTIGQKEENSDEFYWPEPNSNAYENSGLDQFETTTSSTPIRQPNFLNSVVFRTTTQKPVASTIRVAAINFSNPFLSHGNNFGSSGTDRHFTTTPFSTTKTPQSNFSNNFFLHWTTTKRPLTTTTTINPGYSNTFIPFHQTTSTRTTKNPRIIFPQSSNVYDVGSSLETGQQNYSPTNQNATFWTTTMRPNYNFNNFSRNIPTTVASTRNPSSSQNSNIFRFPGAKETTTVAHIQNIDEGGLGFNIGPTNTPPLQISSTTSIDDIFASIFAPQKPGGEQNEVIPNFLPHSQNPYPQSTGNVQNFDQSTIFSISSTNPWLNPVVNSTTVQSTLPLYPPESSRLVNPTVKPWRHNAILEYQTTTSSSIFSSNIQSPDEINNINFQTQSPGTPSKNRSGERKAIEACANYTNIASLGLTFHILGGEPTYIGEFPHMAALGYLSDEAGTSYLWDCGGALISERYVITAAHCIHNPNRRPGIVRLGVVALQGTDNPATDVGIMNFISHPEYQGSRRYNDIGLILLDRVIEFSDSIRPACLNADLNEVSPAITMFVTGWGSINAADERSNVLLKAALSAVPLTSCNDVHLSAGPDRKLPSGLISTQMCAADAGRKRDACSGDSGGPIQIVNNVNQMSTLVGITSFGTRICASSNIPGVYTKISAYLDWIETVVWR